MAIICTKQPVIYYEHPVNIETNAGHLSTASSEACKSHSRAGTGLMVLPSSSRCIHLKGWGMLPGDEESQSRASWTAKVQPNTMGPCKSMHVPRLADDTDTELSIKLYESC